MMLGEMKSKQPLSGSGGLLNILSAVLGTTGAVLWSALLCVMLKADVTDSIRAANRRYFSMDFCKYLFWEMKYYYI